MSNTKVSSSGMGGSNAIGIIVLALAIAATLLKAEDLLHYRIICIILNSDLHAKHTI